MQKGISGLSFDGKTPIAEAARAAAAAGFGVFEPVVSETGELRPDTDEATCRAIADAIRAAGLEVASLATCLFGNCNYASPDPADRARARDLTIAMLDRARWMGAPAILVVPAVIGCWDEKAPRVRYDDALAAVATTLHELAPEAETRSVRIAVENVWNRFLLSPVEMRDLIDQVNSPWVRVYFNVGNALQTGYPQDWIRILGRRIFRVHIKDYRLVPGGIGGFCPPGDGDVDWPAVMTALTLAGYDGPLTCEGPGEPADIGARMDRILETTWDGAAIRSKNGRPTSASRGVG